MGLKLPSTIPNQNKQKIYNFGDVIINRMITP